MAAGGLGHRAGGRRLTLAADFFLIASVALLFLLPSLMNGVPNGHDYPYHIVWVEMFTAQMTAGELYPRWVEGLWLGAGGADFFFYAPFPFWLAGALRFVACSGCGADQLLMLTGFVLLAISGFGFRALAGRFSSRWAANAGALIYMALPYHLGADWYDRLALGEFTAAAILPWHLLAFLDCVGGKRGGRGGALRLALLSGVLATSHLPTAMIAATGYFALMFFIERPRGWRPFAAPMLAGVVGLGLGALYWYPAIMLLDSVRADLIAVPKLTWRLNILLPANFGQSAFYDSVWPAFAALSILSLAAIFAVPRGSRAMARTVAVLLAVVWLMVTPLSVLVWETTPIARIQFPWRFLILADLAFGLAVSMVVETLTRPDLARPRRGVAGALLCAIVLVVAVFAHPAVRGYHSTAIPPEDLVRLSPGALEWLPNETLRTLDIRSYRDVYDLSESLSAQPPVLLAGPGRVELLSTAPRRMIFEAELPAPANVVLRRTFWRFWRLRNLDSGREIATEPTTGFPLIAAELPAGRGRYVLELPVLMAEWVGALISGLALVVLFGWWRLTRPRTGS